MTPSGAVHLAMIIEGRVIRPENTLIAAPTSTSQNPETKGLPGQALRPAQFSESRAAKVIREIFESGRPLTYVRSTEEQRVAKILREVAARIAAPSPVTVWTWSLTEGLRKDSEAVEPGSQSPRVALDFIDAYRGAAIFHLKDFHEPLRESPEIRRRLRDLHQSCRDRWKFTVISSPVRGIPEELDRSLMFVELRLPDLVELVQFLREETRQISAQLDGASINDGTLHQFGRALQGLTLEEARFALRRGLAVGKGLGPESLPALFEEKRLLVNRGGVIEYISEAGNMADVGGLPGLKKWLLERKKLFQMRDSQDDEIVPKGILIMGIPGCGKSLSIKATASYFELPLYRVDMTAVFSGQHGTPDAVFVDACKTMEDVAPAVLWFDEIETGMVAAADSGGAQARLFAFFLTWMQEKTRGLFVAATANRIDLLPAELLRKGRFDELFFVDLPTDDERLEIFQIHLGLRGVDSNQFDLHQLTAFTNGWTGAEVEQCVVSSITKARLADRAVTEHDLLSVAAAVVPLSHTMKEQINHIRNWAFERAVRASPRQTGR
jgi:hypothetical protein